MGRGKAPSSFLLKAGRASKSCEVHGGQGRVSAFHRDITAAQEHRGPLPRTNELVEGDHPSV